MKNLIAAVLLTAFALAGCAAPNTAPLSTEEQHYLYGNFAGEPQRPTLMD